MKPHKTQQKNKQNTKILSTVNLYAEGIFISFKCVVHVGYTVINNVTNVPQLPNNLIEFTGIMPHFVFPKL